MAAGATFDPFQIELLNTATGSTAQPNTVASIGLSDNIVANAILHGELSLANSTFDSKLFSVFPISTNDIVFVSSINNTISNINLTDVNGRTVKLVNVKNFSDTSLNIADL